MITQRTDYLIIGAGILGLTLARELLIQGITDIIILEKEPEIGLHASGRNSGVMHAGIYYQEDTMKAKFCQYGSRLMINYCEKNDLPVMKSGKVIIAKTESELSALDTLYSRAGKNGARVELIDEQALKEIEPSAATVDRAIFSPDTAMVDPRKILTCLEQELTSKGVKILKSCSFLGLKNKEIAFTSQGDLCFKFCINAAGAYADKIAHAFGVGKEYGIMPFKGTYYQLRPTSSCHVNGNIYPVPDLRNPFLGVHFTRNIHGVITAGPTAIPCFGRENYRGLNGINHEAGAIIKGAAKLFMSNAGFRQVAITEPRKYIKKYLYNDALKLVKDLNYSDLESCKKVGIRPQLIHWPSKGLVMDFLIQKTNNSLHVLNAISPAFTCSMAIAKHIASQLCQSIDERAEII